MKIVLLQPALEDFYTTPIRLYPLGLLYTAALLRRSGHSIKLVDALTPLKKRTLPLPPEMHYLRSWLGREPGFFNAYYRFGRDDADLVAEIVEWQPDAIGISSQFTAYYKNVHDIATALKKACGVPIFLGGHHATIFAAACRQRTPAIDAVCTGTAETGLAAMPALAGGALVKAAVDWREIMPAHDLIAPGGYRIGRRPYASIMASRGCPQACEFCGVGNMFGHRLSLRSAEGLLAEMVHLRRDRGVRIFNFEDDNLSANRSWFAGFLRRLVAEPALHDIELTAMNGLCYPHLDRELLELMCQAGFKRLNLSWVTRDPRLRRQLNRPRDREKIELVIRDAQELGLQVTVYLIIGLPGQSEAEVRQSIDHLLDLGVLVGPSIFYLPPATPLFDRLELPRHIRENWNLYRSSAFAVETAELGRQQLVDLFLYVRRENLRRRSPAQA